MQFTTLRPGQPPWHHPRQWDAAVQADPALPELLDGLHFHTLCEQDADALALTLAAVEAKFGGLLPRMKWLNFGGGHHITRPGYRLATLEQCITETQKKYGVQVYLEPGEAWALNAGYLVTTVLDTLQNGETSLPFWTCLRPATPRM